MDPDQAVSYVSAGIQCQDLQTEANTKIHVVKVGAVEDAASKSQSQSLKHKILEELANCNRALREFERLYLVIIENESNDEEKKRKKADVEIVKEEFREFTRETLGESEKESHIDGVKNCKKLIDDHVCRTNRTIKKLEKKKKNKNQQPASKKNKK